MCSFFIVFLWQLQLFNVNFSKTEKKKEKKKEKFLLMLGVTFAKFL